MALTEDLKKIIVEKKYSNSFVAKALNISPATLHLWLNNKYAGHVDKVNEAVAKFIEIEHLREDNVQIQFIKTSIVKHIFEIATTCHVENEIGVCYGNAGLGKTFAVKRFAIENPGVILIEADLGYSPKVLFSELHKKLGFDGTGTVHEMFLNIVEKLKYSGRLIIIDEAEHLPYKSLELIRRIYDKANIGILLVGMKRLINNLKGANGQYAQIYSRVGIVTELTKLTNNDEEAIIRSLIPKYKFSFKTISDASKGNTRILTKLLVRAIRIVQFNKGSEFDDAVLNTSIRKTIL